MSLYQKKNSNKNMFLCLYIKKRIAAKICSYVFMSKKEQQQKYVLMSLCQKNIFM